MSEAKEGGGSEHELPGLFKDQHMAKVAEEERLQSLVQNPVAEQNSELHADSHLDDNSVLVEAPVELHPVEETLKPVEQNIKQDGLPLDLKNGTGEAIPMNQLDSVSNQKASVLNAGSDQSASVDVKIGNESESVEVQPLENVGMVPETDVKAVNSDEKDPTEDTPMQEKKAGGEYSAHVETSNQSYSFEPNFLDGDDSGTEEEQASFMKVLENFHRERSLEFKPPKFYGEGLNCLKLWRQVTRLGGYDQVTSCKLWRQVGESFRPPKTCTTVSWSFRIFYEKALLEYEKHKIRTGELQVPISSLSEPMSTDHEVGGTQASGSGRARRDAAARAMQGWHSQRLLGNGEVGEPIIKDKSSISLQKRDKHLKSIGVLKRKKGSSLDRAVKVARTKSVSPHMDVMVVDVGAPADWVKINVRRTKDCFEVYALVPGLLREEVHVQSDPAGRLVISGEPEQPDNPWGVTPFKKVITLPSRIDPHQTSAVVTLHGQLFVRAPFEQSDL